jgi:UDP-glucose 4-epimerase
VSTDLTTNGAAAAQEGGPLRRIEVVGGAGFIGAHFVDRLLADHSVEVVRVYDNFSSGREWHLRQHREDPRLEVVVGDVADLESLTRSMAGIETVIHLASNPDIARAATEPAVDFDQGTLLTHHVVEAMRRAEVRRILYASGSGVYGDLGEVEPGEDYGPLIPISTYGASKLAGETLIASYCYMFDLIGVAFRFGNVVGPRQTHGVGFDFVRRLLAEPAELTILGDGSQSKSYVHVSDVMDAVLLAAARAPRPYSVFNVATGDYITVREIAELAVEAVGREAGSTIFAYTGGDRGWRGDVPVMRLNTDRIRALGWANARTTKQALADSLLAMLDDARAGRFS